MQLPVFSNSCLCFSYLSIRENTIEEAAILIKEHF